jgi:hypothetical protein
MTACHAIVAVNGKTASCELDAPHPGVAHHAIPEEGMRFDWISHGEAVAAERKARAEAAS